MGALVSSEDMVAMARLHLDRLYDLAGRLGASPDEAIDIAETSVREVTAALVSAPGTVVDLAGAAYAATRALARQLRPVAGGAPALSREPDGPDQAGDPEATRVLPLARRGPRDPAGQQPRPTVSPPVGADLDVLGERARSALLLRDCYRLDLTQAARGLDTDVPGLLRAVAQARAGWLAAPGERRAAAAGAVGAHPVELAEVAALADGAAEQLMSPDEVATLREHVRGCAVCSARLQTQARARARAVTLAFARLEDPDREAMLVRLAAHARASLPGAAEVTAARGALAAAARRRGVSATPVVLAIAIAALLGVAAGVVSSPSAHRRSALAAPPVPTRTRTPPPSSRPSPTPSAAPATPAAASPPSTPVAVTSAAVSSAPPAAPVTPAPVSSPARAATITLRPSFGPNGTTITVTGQGWLPGAVVTLRYLDALGSPTGSGVTVTPDSTGAFAVTLVAEDPTGLPGPHQVHAGNASQTANATFQATT